MTKADLKTGMFGRTNNNWWFVVVHDTLVYEEGGYDTFEEMDDDLNFEAGWCIDFVVYANSFEHAKTITPKSTRCVFHRTTPVKFLDHDDLERHLGYPFYVVRED